MEREAQSKKKKKLLLRNNFCEEWKTKKKLLLFVNFKKVQLKVDLSKRKKKKTKKSSTHVFMFKLCLILSFFVFLFLLCFLFYRKTRKFLSKLNEISTHKEGFAFFSWFFFLFFSLALLCGTPKRNNFFLACSEVKQWNNKKSFFFAFCRKTFSEREQNGITTFATTLRVTNKTERIFTENIIRKKCFFFFTS